MVAQHGSSFLERP